MNDFDRILECCFNSLDSRSRQEKYEEALTIVRNNKELKIEYIHILIDLGKTNTAEKYLEEFEFVREKTMEVLAVKGRLFYNKGQEEKDEQYSDKGINLLLESWKKILRMPSCIKPLPWVTKWLMIMRKQKR